jgi:hypothetical protein
VETASIFCGVHRIFILLRILWILQLIDRVSDAFVKLCILAISCCLTMQVSHPSQPFFFTGFITLTQDISKV